MNNETMIETLLNDDFLLDELLTETTSPLEALQDAKRDAFRDFEQCSIAFGRNTSAINWTRLESAMTYLQACNNQLSDYREKNREFLIDS